MDKYNKLVIVYTMDGCPFCEMMKNQLMESKIDFIERNIKNHEHEYNLFVETTGSESVPAFMIIENALSKPLVTAYTPEKDYMTIEEGVQIIKNKLNG